MKTFITAATILLATITTNVNAAEPQRDSQWLQQCAVAAHVGISSNLLSVHTVNQSQYGEVLTRLARLDTLEQRTRETRYNGHNRGKAQLLQAQAAAEAERTMLYMFNTELRSYKSQQSIFFSQNCY